MSTGLKGTAQRRTAVYPAEKFFPDQPAGGRGAGLYATARDWVAVLPVTRLWDLFCGVGGFGLHVCRPGMQRTGIEISAEAIANVRQSSRQLGLDQVSFQALDSIRFALQNGAALDPLLQLSGRDAYAGSR